MEILSFSVRVVKAETAKKLRPPAAPSLAGQRDEAGFICSAVPPGFRPYTRSRAALKRRNGAHRPALAGCLQPFTRAAQERTSAYPRMEALSAGEASLFAVGVCVLSPSLRFEIFRFHNHKSSYHIFPCFASREAFFAQVFRFCLLFCPGYDIVKATFY